MICSTNPHYGAYGYVLMHFPELHKEFEDYGQFLSKLAPVLQFDFAN